MKTLTYTERKKEGKKETKNGLVVFVENVQREIIKKKTIFKTFFCQMSAISNDLVMTRWKMCEYKVKEKTNARNECTSQNVLE